MGQYNTKNTFINLSSLFIVFSYKRRNKTEEKAKKEVNMTCEKCKNYDDETSYPGTGYCKLYDEYVNYNDSCPDFEEVKSER